MKNGKIFLEQIKEHFRIKNKIHTRKGAYDLYLGADLFNEMLRNYEDSLPRKRIELESKIKRNKRLLEEREKIYLEASKKAAITNRKFLLTKDQLRSYLINYAPKEIALKFNVSVGTVYRYIKKYKLDK